MDIYGHGKIFFPIDEIEHKDARQHGNFVLVGFSAEQYRYFPHKKPHLRKNIFSLWCGRFFFGRKALPGVGQIVEKEDGVPGRKGAGQQLLRLFQRRTDDEIFLRPAAVQISRFHGADEGVPH